jgi:glycosyltransferase involved in cell wall biosynthesis
MTRKLAYLSGAPRVSTKPIAEATGARQHVLGTMSGFKANDWQIAPYIVGDKVPENWIKAGQQKNMAKSFFRRLAADGMRMLLSAKHAYKALRQIPQADWVYERYGALQLFGYFFQRRGTPWILETNNPFFHESTSDRKSVALPFLVRWAEKFAYQKCDILVVVSEDLKRIISTQLGIPAGKIIVLPNAADTETFNPDTVTPRRLFGPEIFVIGFQGNMYKWAGVEHLVRTVAALRADGRNVAAVLLGDGQERQNLEALARELKIADYIKFPGRVPREQVPEYIAGYDLCYSGQINLSTNSMYHSPLKLYDYMAMGKPVLASRFPDAAKLTQDGAWGYLYTPESLDDLITTARRAYDERASLPEKGVAARASILANHSWSGRMRDFIALAESILAQQPARPVKVAGYSPAERMVARTLEKMPWLRVWVRDAYYAQSYLRKREKGFVAEVAPGYQLQSAAAWAGVTPHNGPTFFGYYDKSPFSADNRYLLQHEGTVAGAPLSVVAYDSAAHQRISLGQTPAWMWQQGAQATWLPALGSAVAGYNTVENSQLGFAIVDLTTQARRFVPFPIQYVLAGGAQMLSLNYCRLLKTIPDYGYDVQVSNFSANQPEAQDGVWRVDLKTGHGELILSLTQLRQLKPLSTMDGAQHYVNHCYPSPDGMSFLVIHRWVTPQGRMLSRLLVVPLDGKPPRILLDEGKVSHFCWKSDHEFVVWARSVEHGDCYHLVDARTGHYVPFGRGVADVYGDGHPTFSRNQPHEFLTDTYPDKKRQQHVLLFDSAANQLREVGRFLSPWAYRNLFRCDLHPRFSPDESLISIDSAHTGTRQSYVITRAR